MSAFDITRPLVASGAVGLANRALYEAARYAQTRETMGKPIISHQAIAFMLADMAIAVESSRGMVWKACAMKDAGQRNTFYASIAKCIASKAAVDNANSCVQVHGGAGYNTEYPAEKLFRDSKILSVPLTTCPDLSASADFPFCDDTASSMKELHRCGC